MKQDKPKLIARIDGHGVTWIGRFGVDDKWVKQGNQRPVTIVRNEQGGEDVTPEDIGFAVDRHKRASGNYTFFSNEKIKELFYGE